ncbi:MAG: hypothetical protein M1829_001509 [Trizodia sp. TS-e1964]|nr:MAG: hypothetical protein M1829_001509 [Trizodia sp. TS-e1964]
MHSIPSLLAFSTTLLALLSTASPLLGPAQNIPAKLQRRTSNQSAKDSILAGVQAARKIIQDTHLPLSDGLYLLASYIKPAGATTNMNWGFFVVEVDMAYYRALDAPDLAPDPAVPGKAISVAEALAGKPVALEVGVPVSLGVLYGQGVELQVFGFLTAPMEFSVEPLRRALLGTREITFDMVMLELRKEAAFSPLDED